MTCKLGELADPDPEQIISNCLGALFNNPGMSSILIFDQKQGLRRTQELQQTERSLFKYVMWPKLQE